MFLILLPFFGKDTKKSVSIAITFTLFTILGIVAFPRPGVSFIFGMPGIALIAGTVFLTDAYFLKRLFGQRQGQRVTIVFLIGFVFIFLGALGIQAYYASDFRYINAIIPFLPQQTSFTASVAEHSKPTVVDYFTNYSILLMFAGLGAWALFRQRDYLAGPILLLAISAMYVGTGLVRLLVYASIGNRLASVGRRHY